MAIKEQSLDITGMHCESCSQIIEKKLKETKGILHAEADYVTGTCLVRFDDSKASFGSIRDALESINYGCAPKEGEATEETEDSIEAHGELGPKSRKSSWFARYKKITGIFSGVLGFFIFGYFVVRFGDGTALPEMSRGLSYGLLFLVGLMTGFHCVSMCGGFVVGYTAKAAKSGRNAYRGHLMYGLGKTISYTVIGAAFGLLGSIVTFTPAMRGVAGILAGLFLLVFGLNMLNIFPSLRRFRLRLPGVIGRYVGSRAGKHSSPLVIGLLTGLMIACGPLQAIYIMAAGTGSWLEGAKLLFIFAVGTIPVMLGFGFMTSFISGKATHKILKASGFIVILLGLIMINRGLALTGSGFDTNSLLTSVLASDEKDTGALESEDGYQVIRMEVNRYGWQPDKFVLKKGVPVKWVIDGKEINGCNNAIQVPKLGLEFNIRQGEQVIEFTPDEEGIIPWSCWMGMIPGTFIVKEDVKPEDKKEIEEQAASAAAQQRGTCGGSCGNPTCGQTTSCGCGGR